MITRPWLVVRPRRLPLSFRVDRRVPLVLLGALLVTLAAMVINIGVGEYPVATLDVVRAVLGLPTANQTDAFIVNTLRLPRMLVAALVGLGLGIAGAILQGLTRNPLAEPAILGISTGAGLVAVTLIVVVRNVPGSLISAATFAGALLITGLIYVLAWRGGDSPIRLVLVGVGFSSVAGALISMMITFGNINDVQRALVWLTGSVYGSTWSEVWTLLPWIVVFVPLAILLARDLNALSLGEEVARGLGSQVMLRRGLLLTTAVALTATTVSAAGTISFVGLVAPHVARRLVGSDQSGLLPTAGILGTLIVVLADLVGRTIFAPIELPCGLVTAAIGAPFFLFLLYQQRHT